MDVWVGGCFVGLAISVPTIKPYLSKTRLHTPKLSHQVAASVTLIHAGESYDTTVQDAFNSKGMAAGRFLFAHDRAKSEG